MNRSLLARALLVIYAVFLLFYFVPWNFKQVDEAEELEKFLKQRGNIHSLDELSIGLTGLFAFSFVICSLISVYKIAALIFASNLHSKNVADYCCTLVLSVVLSLACHEKSLLSIQNTINVSRTVSGCISLCLCFAQVACSFTRGAILYQILDTSKHVRATNDTMLKTVYATIRDINIFVTSFWWFCSVFYGVVYYNEVRICICKLECHILRFYHVHHTVCLCVRATKGLYSVYSSKCIVFFCLTDSDMHH